MNSNIIEGQWKEIKGKVQHQWGKLTDDDLDKIDGNRTRLLGAIQKQYGIAQDEAEEQIKEWEDKFDA